MQLPWRGEKNHSIALSLSFSRDPLSPSVALSLSQQQLSCVRLPPHRSSLPRARLPISSVSSSLSLTCAIGPHQNRLALNSIALSSHASTNQVRRFFSIFFPLLYVNIQIVYCCWLLLMMISKSGCSSDFGCAWLWLYFYEEGSCLALT